MFKDDEIRPIVDEVVQVCQHLKISSDPLQWSVDDTIKWLVYYIQLLKLNNKILDTFKISGQSLCNLKIDDFQQVQAVDLYWKLQVWKKCLNFGTNHFHYERDSSESDTRSWNSKENFDLSSTINMSWLDEDYNDSYTLTCLDDDFFKFDSFYHHNQNLPSLDDISLTSFYNSSSIIPKFDSKYKDEIIQFSQSSFENNFQTKYDYDNQNNSSSLEKNEQQSSFPSSIQHNSESHNLVSNLAKKPQQQHYYLSSEIDNESTYLTLLQPQPIENNNQQITSHDQTINTQFTNNLPLPSIRNNNLSINTQNSNNIQNSINLQNTINLQNPACESNLPSLKNISNLPKTPIKLNNTNKLIIELNDTHQQTNNYHLHIHNTQYFENNKFNRIDSNQLIYSPSSISSTSSTSSLSSPLPSLHSPVLSPSSTKPSISSTTNTNIKKPVVRTNGKHGRNNIQLWQFLKELLNQPHLYENCIKWINRKEGEFRIVNSVLVANLWGKRKNRPKMNYDKLSRSIRQYYKKNIMIKTTKSQRLVYKFVGDYMK